MCEPQLFTMPKEEVRLLTGSVGVKQEAIMSASSLHQEGIIMMLTFVYSTIMQIRLNTYKI